MTCTCSSTPPFMARGWRSGWKTWWRRSSPMDAWSRYWKTGARRSPATISITLTGATPPRRSPRFWRNYGPTHPQTGRMRHHLSRGDDAPGGGLSWAASSIRALAFSSLHSDRARDSRDHDDRVVQRDRGGREIDSGWLERITHLAENDIIAIAVVIVATGIVVGP